MRYRWYTSKDNGVLYDTAAGCLSSIDVERLSAGETFYVHDSMPGFNTWYDVELEPLLGAVVSEPVYKHPDSIRVHLLVNGIDYLYESRHDGQVVELYTFDGMLLADAEFDSAVEQCFANRFDNDGDNATLNYFELQDNPEATARSLVAWLEG